MRKKTHRNPKLSLAIEGDQPQTLNFMKDTRPIFLFDLRERNNPDVPTLTHFFSSFLDEKADLSPPSNPTHVLAWGNLSVQEHSPMGEIIETVGCQMTGNSRWIQHRYRKKMNHLWMSKDFGFYCSQGLFARVSNIKHPLHLFRPIFISCNIGADREGISPMYCFVGASSNKIVLPPVNTSVDVRIDDRWVSCLRRRWSWRTARLTRTRSHQGRREGRNRSDEQCVSCSGLRWRWSWRTTRLRGRTRSHQGREGRLGNHKPHTQHEVHAFFQSIQRQIWLV